MKRLFDVVIADLDRGILGRNDDGTYKYVYTVPPTWEIHMVDNLKRDELKNQPYITQLMIDLIKWQFGGLKQSPKNLLKDWNNRSSEYVIITPSADTKIFQIRSGKNMNITIRKFTCCLCGEEFEGHGNNPYPLTGKECCTACDCIYVNPIRNYINNIKRKK